MSRAARSAIALASLGAVLFSAKAVVVKLCYRHGADAETVLALRMLLAVPFFWTAVAWQTVTRRPAPLARRDVLRILLLGFVGYYVSSYLDFLGLQYISAGLERIILYLNPTMVLLLSALFLGRHVAARQWLAMGVAYAGVVLVFLHDLSIDGGEPLLGSTLVLIAAFTYAIYLIFAGELVSRVGSVRLVAYASTSATVFCVAQALLKDPRAMLSQPQEVYGLSLINAAFCTFLPMLFIMAAVKRIGPGPAAQAGVIGPVSTVFLGWYFLGEAIGPSQLLGVVVVLIGMSLMFSESPAGPTRQA
jgi:drug/metabolite transporter (DMT)-like permease